MSSIMDDLEEVTTLHTPSHVIEEEVTKLYSSMRAANDDVSEGLDMLRETPQRFVSRLFQSPMGYHEHPLVV